MPVSSLNVDVVDAAPYSLLSCPLSSHLLLHWPALPSCRAQQRGHCALLNSVDTLHIWWPQLPEASSALGCWQHLATLTQPAPSSVPCDAEGFVDMTRSVSSSDVAAATATTSTGPKVKGSVRKLVHKVLAGLRRMVCMGSP